MKIKSYIPSATGILQPVRHLLMYLFLAGGFAFLPLGSDLLHAQRVAINSTGAAPNASALLDIDASPGNDKGLLIPRLTTAERNAIASPATSLLIYNSTTDCLEMYSVTGQWVSIGCGCQLPGSFSAIAASGITATSFDANWTASAGATTYFLDVSTVNTFATFVTGYNNLNVGNVLTASVTGLSCTTTYYYRVRANNSCGTSSNSNTITVITSSTAPGSQTFSYTGSPQTFTVPACITSITVKIVGGGGGGQMGWGNNNSAGGGGAAGSPGTYITGSYAVTPSSVLTINVGNGGAAGTGACVCGTSCHGPTGAAGSASSIVTLVTAAGGAGGDNGGACGNVSCGGSWYTGWAGAASSYPGSTGGSMGCNGCSNCSDGQGGTAGGNGTLGGGGGGGASSLYNPNDSQTNGGNGGDGYVEISW